MSIESHKAYLEKYKKLHAISKPESEYKRQKRIRDARLRLACNLCDVVEAMGLTENNETLAAIVAGIRYEEGKKPKTFTHPHSILGRIFGADPVVGTCVRLCEYADLFPDGYPQVQAWIRRLRVHNGVILDYNRVEGTITFKGVQHEQG